MFRIRIADPHQHLPWETERQTLLSRIQQLEKENDALRNGKS